MVFRRVIRQRDCGRRRDGNYARACNYLCILQCYRMEARPRRMYRGRVIRGSKLCGRAWVFRVLFILWQKLVVAFLRFFIFYALMPGSADASGRHREERRRRTIIRMTRIVGDLQSGLRTGRYANSRRFARRYRSGRSFNVARSIASAVRR